ncbi:hypothetical protein FK220_007130 [Flavobacteriaceae bacterium TP-CH-4]|uniref:Uncharacterized protein n=1 Tax=Pelagihabitans pacificus TaxID=2696054 RepID=A0A967ARM8_9FLAO|nr:hypothetical protein [Pelagihabitans pacificus]NHF59106.1 hypothetical protein [Pelagihabitans pacificus]
MEKLAYGLSILTVLYLVFLYFTAKLFFEDFRIIPRREKSNGADGKHPKRHLKK